MILDLRSLFERELKEAEESGDPLSTWTRYTTVATLSLTLRLLLPTLLRLPLTTMHAHAHTATSPGWRSRNQLRSDPTKMHCRRALSTSQNGRTTMLTLDLQTSTSNRWALYFHKFTPPARVWPVSKLTWNHHVLMVTVITVLYHKKSRSKKPAGLAKPSPFHFIVLIAFSRPWARYWHYRAERVWLTRLVK